jgi:hypothetical protein
VGGFFTLAGVVGKYLFDRRTETHKANLASTAKRREQYHEMQTEAIVGMCVRLNRSLNKAHDSFINEQDIENDLLSETATERIKRELEGAREVEADLKTFTDSHELYLPEELERPVSALSRKLTEIALRKWMLVRAEPTARKMSLQGVEALRQDHLQAIGLLVDLKEASRKALRS